MPLRRILTLALVATGLAVGVLLSTSSSQPASADVNDFSFDSWDIEYEVSFEDDRAKLHATETITASFPEDNQNRGIVRGLPASYQDASTNVEVISVTDGSGGAVPWELEDDSDEVLVLTGDDEYVHGAQTYIIEYSMDDVVLAAQQTGLDEFYWDLLPADRLQTINNFTARITFDEVLTAALTGDSACYQGELGSTDRCELDGPVAVPNGGSAFTVAIDELPASAGATVAIGMTPGTVTQPEDRVLGGGDYLIDTWDAEYRIGLDNDGRSVMHATETIIASFPESVRSRGITRSLDTTLQRIPTQAKVQSVTDAAGNEVVWQVDEGETFVEISADPESTKSEEFLHGEHTFVIEYTMRDVITTSADEGSSGSNRDDSFRWDILPGGQEPIAAFSARVIFDETLSNALTDDHRCFGHCELSAPEETADGTVFTATSVAVNGTAGVNRNPADSHVRALVQIDVAQGAVTQPLPRRNEPVMTVLPHVLAGSGVVLGGVGGIAAIVIMRRRARQAGGTVVAQYEVPRDLPQVVATVLGAGSTGVEAAQIMHLAVNNVIRFTEVKEVQRKGLDLSGSALRAELVNPVSADDEAAKFDLQTQHAMFGADAQAGATRKFETNDQQFTKSMQSVREAGAREAISRGWVVKQRSKRAMIFAGVALALAVVTLGLACTGLSLSMRGSGAAMASAIIATVVLGIVFAICCVRFRVVTPEGAKVGAYLEGVKLFIKVAEADRLEMLQSYAGAERRADGDIDVIRVYEKLLPYAMLAGRTQDWSEVLRVAYSSADVMPHWAARTDMDLGDLLKSVTSGVQAVAVVASPGASSAGGGSTGGGFSGGGGGGGSVGGR